MKGYFIIRRRIDCNLFYIISLCLLRAESVRGQLDGTIPSTIAAQEKDKRAFVDASEIWLPDLGEIADLKDGYH